LNQLQDLARSWIDSPQIAIVTFPRAVPKFSIDPGDPRYVAAGFYRAKLLIGGALQFTRWTAQQLAYCRESPGRGCTLPVDAGTAWRHGLRLGLPCSYCFAGPSDVF